MLLESYEIHPVRTEIGDPRKRKLHENVRRAISTIESSFSSPINIEGIDATDLFSMNTLLGSAIEVSTVQTLRSLREVWDPDNEWVDYDFFRFPQSFPDVRLVRCEDIFSEPEIGIELKSWYLLSKEAEPSFRHRVTSSACNPWDLFVIVPWSLSNVLSGTPIVYSPWIEQAQYVSEMRNFYWLNTRKDGKPSPRDAVEIPDDVYAYPPPNSLISDKPLADKGSNYGRIGRVHELVGSWTRQCLDIPLLGIKALDWVLFLKEHTESLTRSDLIEFQQEFDIDDLEDLAYQILEFCDIQDEE